MSVFEPVSTSLDFPAAEAEVLEFWKQNDIFRKSLSLREGAERFVFYEGPPTANGLPHPGHVLTRVVKDLYPRYKTMCGCYVPRKAGWDTHGLPVEVEVEKELGIEGKPGIEKFGVERFVRKCIESVFRYTAEWERLTERIGFWLDLSEAYVTFHEPYVESVWWALKQIHAKGLLVRGHKSVPWCPRCSTALSSHEVGWGYREVTEESVFVGFRSKTDPRTYFLAWTTTPWTLPSNAALAVKPDAVYAKVKLGEETLILARDLVSQTMGDLPCQVVGTVRGEELVGLEYEPLFPYADTQGKRAYVVLAADFVTVEPDPTGQTASTGIVHVAPGFGEDDYRLGQREGLPVIQLVDPQGRFTEPTPWAGRFIKDVDPEIVADLARRKLLLRTQQITHQYPFCWRCDSPLIYYARKGWFIKTTALIDRIIANNRQVNWLPEHIKEGRFGKFLATNVDWALSRERYWGTPLPVWVCGECGSETVPGSVSEILQNNPRAFEAFEAARRADPSLNPHLRIHKPWIDQVTLTCGACGGTMRRVPEVIDCWFDAGAMPFAQFGYPHRGREEFERNFPADFIAEARRRKRPCQVAFSPDDLAITKHAIYLQDGIRRQGDVYIADMWYYPYGVEPNARPLVMDTGAREMGYYEGSDKDFSFADAYAPLDFTALRICEARVWSFFRRVAPRRAGRYLKYVMGDSQAPRLPPWIRPEHKLTVQEMMQLMRDHFEDSPMDLHRGVGAGPYQLPYRWRPLTWKVDGQEYFNERATSTQQTGFSFIAQMRAQMPGDIGGVLWFGVDDTASTDYELINSDDLSPVQEAIVKLPKAKSSAETKKILADADSLVSEKDLEELPDKALDKQPEPVRFVPPKTIEPVPRPSSQISGVQELMKSRPSYKNTSVISGKFKKVQKATKLPAQRPNYKQRIKFIKGGKSSAKVEDKSKLDASPSPYKEIISLVKNKDLGTAAEELQKIENIKRIEAFKSLNSENEAEALETTAITIDEIKAKRQKPKKVSVENKGALLKSRDTSDASEVLISAVGIKKRKKRPKSQIINKPVKEKLLEAIKLEEDEFYRSRNMLARMYFRDWLITMLNPHTIPIEPVDDVFFLDALQLKKKRAEK